MDNMENIAEDMPLKKTKLCTRLGVLPQIIRAVSHMKENLNAVTVESISTFKKENEVVFAEISRLVKAKLDAKANVELKTQLDTELNTFRELPTTKQVTVSLKQLKKDQYRMNSKAINRMLVVVHNLLDELVTYGLTSDQPKVFREYYNNTRFPQFGQLTIYPLISNLVDKVVEPQEPKRKLSYKSAVEASFKQHKNETSSGKKMVLVSDTKEYIASLVSEFINKLTFYIKNLTDSKRVKTITDLHVDLALKFMFYHDDLDLVKHQLFLNKTPTYVPLVQPPASVETPTEQVSEVPATDAAATAAVPVPALNTFATKRAAAAAARAAGGSLISDKLLANLKK